MLISFGVSNVYLQALIILVAFFIIAKIVVYVCEGILLTLAKKTKTKIDDLILKRVNRKISLILILFGVKLAILPLPLLESVNVMLQDILSSIIWVIVALAAMNITNIVLTEWGKTYAKRTGSKIDKQMLHLSQRFFNILFIILAFLFILHVWDIKIGPLLASLGIAGLAIAFALQKVLGNIFGGISLILDKSVKVGDRIELDTGESGIVKDVGIRSTRIKTWDNKITVIPNGILADMKITNYIRQDKKTRVVVPFGVAYGTDIEKVRKTIIPVLKKVKNALKDPEPKVHFKLMSDFSLDFDAKLWVSDVSEAFPAKLEATEAVYNALNKAKIDIPFPTRTIHMKK